MLFRAFTTYEKLTRADIRNPDSKTLDKYHSLIRMIPSIFLLSNGFRHYHDFQIFFLDPFEEKILFKIDFLGEKLRYLSPDWLSSGALLVKAFKKYEKNVLRKKYEEKIFVNPGVFIYLFENKKLSEINWSKVVFIDHDFLELEKLNKEVIGDIGAFDKLDFLLLEKKKFDLANNKVIIFSDSFSQVITIINFSMDNTQKK